MATKSKSVSRRKRRPTSRVKKNKYFTRTLGTVFLSKDLQEIVEDALNDLDVDGVYVDAVLDCVPVPNRRDGKIGLRIWLSSDEDRYPSVQASFEIPGRSSKDDDDDDDDIED